MIELLFVVALIGIMIAIAVPSFAAFLSSYRATSAVNDLLESINLTRTEAMKRGRRVTLSPIGANWRNGWQVYVDTNMPSCGTPAFAAPDALIFQHEALPASITVSASDAAATPFAGTNYVIYDGTGYARNTCSQALQGGIVFKDTTGSAQSYRTMCVGLMGRPRISKLTTGADICTAG